MSQQPMEAEFANLGGAGVGAASNVQAISNIADVLGENARAQNNLLDTVFDSDDYMSTPTLFLMLTPLSLVLLGFLQRFKA